MTAKSKISKAKRDNQKHNKLVKKGVIKGSKNAKKNKNQKKIIPVQQPAIPEEIDSEEERQNDNDMLGMVDEEDLSFLREAIVNQSYNLLQRVKYTPVKQNDKKKNRKRKLEENDTLETQYENQDVEEEKKVKNLLPIKTNTGIIQRSIIDETVETNDADVEEEETKDDASNNESESDEEKFELPKEEFDPSKPITTAEMLAARQESLRIRKIHIGTLSSGLLENPEEKITNFKTLLNIMDEQTAEIYITVRKLAIVSLLEVFKDLLPSYEIKQHKPSEVKLKKDTLQLQKYETLLLQYYKKYLQKLEKLAMFLVKKKGDNRKRMPSDLKLGELAIHCLCDLLIAHPYFNFSQNIAQTIVPFLNHNFLPIRKMVNSSCKTIFKDDKKGEITLKILRLINHYLKKRAHNVNVEMLEVLLALKIKDVNLDQEKEQELKQKKLMSHKQRLLQISKKERKRKKQLEQVEKELMETKAEENKEKKQKNLTEITKLVFGIYFRILKSSNNTKILGCCLEGLAKFTHVINLEFYTDLVRVLDHLLKEDWIGYREQLHCIQTVLIMLSGQGEVLNIDPSRFYTTLYKALLTTHAGKQHENMLIVLQTLTQALIKRRRKLTHQRMIGFTKRLTTLSLQLLHNGSLGCLGMVKNIIQLNSFTDVLLDLDTSVGDGNYFPELEDPEYCNASNTALYELIPLMRHYHPIVCKIAKNIASGVPATGEGSLPPEIGKCTAEQLFEDYDPSEVAFKPSIPVPKTSQQKLRPKVFKFADTNFKEYCEQVTKDSRKRLRRDETGLYFAI